MSTQYVKCYVHTHRPFPRHSHNDVHKKQRTEAVRKYIIKHTRIRITDERWQNSFRIVYCNKHASIQVLFYKQS